MAIFIAFGSNLGRRRTTFRAAMETLERGGARIIGRSSLYETAPVGIPTERRFLNGVLEVEWDGDSPNLLKLLLSTEASLGRRRDDPHGDRTCDLDLLLFHGEVRTDPDLTLPHPRIGERRFVLEPLLELAPGLCDPVLGAAYVDALSALSGQACARVH